MAWLAAILKNKLWNTTSLRGSFPQAGNFFIVDAKTVKFDMHIENTNLTIFLFMTKIPIDHEYMKKTELLEHQ